MKKYLLIICLVLSRVPSDAITNNLNLQHCVLSRNGQKKTKSFTQFVIASDFLDAAINSTNHFNSLIKKEAYRTKIISFNNPTSSDLGFNLENEIQTALKPLLAKAKSTSPSKFSSVVSSLIQTPQRTSGTAVGGKTPAAVLPVNPLYTTLVSLVGNLAVQEKDHPRGP